MSYHRRFTTHRWAALRWFRDHERDVNAVLCRRPPSARMVGMMLQDGQVRRIDTGLRTLPKLVLTEKGQADLDSKGTQRAKGYRPAASRRNKPQEFEPIPASTLVRAVKRVLKLPSRAARHREPERRENHTDTVDRKGDQLKGIGALEHQPRQGDATHDRNQHDQPCGQDQDKHID